VTIGWKNNGNKGTKITQLKCHETIAYVSLNSNNLNVISPSFVGINALCGGSLKSDKCYAKKHLLQITKNVSPKLLSLVRKILHIGNISNSLYIFS
jgi:hypothetical protein